MRPAPLRIGVIGVGRIGRMHAELLARQVPGAAVAASTTRARRPRRRRGRARRAGRRQRRGAARPTSTPSRSARPTDTHVELIVAAAEAGKAVFCEKPVSLELAELDRALAAVEAAGVPFQIGFNRRFDPAHAAVREAVPTGGRRAAPRPDHQPRPRPAAAGVHASLRRAVPRHDDPRLRHGPLRDRHRGRRGVRARGRADRPRDRRGRRRRHGGRHARARRRLPDGDRQLPPRRLRLRPARRGVRRRGDGGVGQPARAYRRSSRPPPERARPPLPHFFLERYMPSYVREWEAFVDAVQRRRAARRSARRRARAAGDRAGGLAVAARGPAGARRRRSSREDLRHRRRRLRRLQPRGVFGDATATRCSRRRTPTSTSTDAAVRRSIAAARA